ncbi:MAG: ornithine cyclodeaminase [Thermomicrobiales bacterium]|nr:ornithine cyclodeaminase [Thermomicrobiales bacterium]
MLALTRSDVQHLVSMPDAIDLMKQAFAELSAGRTTSPLRTVIPVEQHNGDALFMPAFVPAMDALGVKLVNVFKNNASKGLPVIHALVCLIDSETGQALAVMDGTYLTALRTGAVSGAATDLLARPESRTLVAIGAGAQGATQIAAVCAVRPIERIIAVDVFPEALERLRGILQRDWPDVLDRLETSSDANTAVREADIICTATTARTPVFDDANVQPGTHVNAIGAYTPEMQELPAGLVQRASVTLDAIDAALAEAGDLIVPLEQGLVDRDHFRYELGMVVAGTAPRRQSDEEITLFKTVGNAVQDVVVARRAYDRARASGAGIEFDLG